MSATDAASSSTPTPSVLTTATPQPSSASQQQIANTSPLHLQLLLMLGSCHTNPVLMQEAAEVQSALTKITPTPEQQKALKEKNAVLEKEKEVKEKEKKEKETSGGKNKKGKKKGAAAAASSTSDASSSSSSSTASIDDPSLIWSSSSIATLRASTVPSDLLLLALLHDPANPWFLHLRNIDEAIKYYGLAAIKLSSTYSCSRLAHFYITGELITGGRDFAKGAKWLRLGASKGHALCQYQLGYMLEEGEGIERDVKQAVQWYQKAADQKYSAAMYNLATILIEPDDTYDGVDQDIYVAIRLMEDAAALGESRAQLKLGHLCFLGNASLDIEASIPRCIQYLTMAAHHENDPSVEAAIILGIIYSTSETNSFLNEYYDLERSIKYLKIAAESGHADSKVLLQRQIAKLTKVEKGIVKDERSEHAKAVRLLQNMEIGGSTPDKDDIMKNALMKTTPSKESFYLALARLHARYPAYGSTRLHASIKQEYPHWLVSEKRVKLVMKEQSWSADGNPNADAAATKEEEEPAPSENSAAVQQRLVGRKIVNDLD